jgi:coenzyme F420-reducing hydrogenase gamma subunit
MKILAIQGSPRPKASNTEILLQEFLKGARSQGTEAETIYLKEKEFHPCVGCYTCRAKTPGVCVFKDDMPELAYLEVNPVRNYSRHQVILGSNPAAEPCTARSTRQSSRASFLMG